jgi:hypothetical protein
MQQNLDWTGGDAALLGRAFVAPPDAYSPAAYDVTAPIVATNASSWSLARCPPTHPDARAFAGAIVLVIELVPRGCSRESFATAIAAVGFVALLTFVDASRIAHTVPGSHHREFRLGDARNSSLPTADLGPAAVAMVLALQRGAHATVRMRSDGNKWAALRVTAGFRAVQAFNVAYAAGVLELAACSLGAFVRRDGWLRPTLLPHALLLVVLLICAMIIVVNIDLGRGLLDSVVWQTCAGGAILVESVASSIFVAFFAQVASQTGMASPHLASRAHQLVLGGSSAVTIIATVVGTTVWTNSQVIRLIVLGTVYPLVVLLMMLLTYQLVSRSHAMLTLPPPLFSELLRRMRAVVGLHCAAQHGHLVLHADI